MYSLLAYKMQKRLRFHCTITHCEHFHVLILKQHALHCHVVGVVMTFSWIFEHPTAYYSVVALLYMCVCYSGSTTHISLECLGGVSRGSERAAKCSVGLFCAQA